MTASLDKKMLNGFSREVKSYLPSIREGLDTFQNDPARHETLKDTLRYIHTIKGASALMGLAALSQIVSYVEELLEEIMSGHAYLDSPRNQWLTLTIDKIDPYLECLLNGEGENQEIIELIEKRFHQITHSAEEVTPALDECVADKGIENDAVSESHRPEFSDYSMSSYKVDSEVGSSEIQLSDINDPDSSISDMASENFSIEVCSVLSNQYTDKIDRNEIDSLGTEASLVKFASQDTNSSHVGEDPGHDNLDQESEDNSDDSNALIDESSISNSLGTSGARSEEQNISGSTVSGDQNISNIDTESTCSQNKTKNNNIEIHDAIEKSSLSNFVNECNIEEKIYTDNILEDELDQNFENVFNDKDSSTLASQESDAHFNSDNSDEILYTRLNANTDSSLSDTESSCLEEEFDSQDVSHFIPQDDIIYRYGNKESEDVTDENNELQEHTNLDQVCSYAVDDSNHEVYKIEYDYGNDCNQEIDAGYRETTIQTEHNSNVNDENEIQDTSLNLDITDIPDGSADNSENILTGKTESTDQITSSSRSLEELIDTIDSSVVNTYSSKNHIALDPSRSLHTNLNRRYLLFTVGESCYAATVSNILEIGHVPHITSVPNVPGWLAGIINLRGEILSVIDLGHFLGVSDSVKNDDNRLLIVETEGGEVATSLIVDQINGFINLDSDRIDTSSMLFHDKVAPYLGGVFEVGGMIVATLDLEHFLRSPDICQFR